MVLCPQPLKTSVWRISFRRLWTSLQKCGKNALVDSTSLHPPHREVQQVRASGPIPPDLRRILHGCKNRLC